MLMQNNNIFLLFTPRELAGQSNIYGLGRIRQSCTCRTQRFHIAANGHSKKKRALPHTHLQYPRHDLMLAQAFVSQKSEPFLICTCAAQRLKNS